MSPVLTKRKKQLLDFIEQFKNKHGFFPTLEEIAKRFKLKSQSTVHQHLSELEELGLIQRQARQARAMQLAPAEITPAEQHYDGSAITLPLVGVITAGAPIAIVYRLIPIVIHIFYIITNTAAFTAIVLRIIPGTSHIIPFNSCGTVDIRMT